MKHFTLLASIFLSTLSFGQTNHQIDAAVMSWNPNDLTIDVGDSVTFINANNGSHNLNGALATFPTNPEGFEMLTVGTTWTFGKRFNVPGLYRYRCNVHPGSMTGQILVVDPSASLEEKEISFTVYPNPAKDMIYISTSTADFSVKIYDMLGNQVLAKEMKNKTSVNIETLSQGMYMMEITAGNTRTSKRIVKK